MVDSISPRSTVLAPSISKKNNEQFIALREPYRPDGAVGAGGGGPVIGSGGRGWPASGSIGAPSGGAGIIAPEFVPIRPLSNGASGFSLPPIPSWLQPPAWIQNIFHGNPAPNTKPAAVKIPQKIHPLKSSTPKPLNLAKLKSDLGKLAKLCKVDLLPQKIDSLLKPLKRAQLLKMQELTPWLIGEVSNGRMTREEAIEIAERVANTVYTESLIPGGPRERERPDSCTTNGDVTFHQGYPNENRKGIVSARIFLTTNGYKNNIPAVRTITSIEINDPQTGKIVYKKRSSPNNLRVNPNGIFKNVIIKLKPIKDFPSYYFALSWRDGYDLNGQNQIVKVKGYCVFNDGTRQPAVNRSTVIIVN